jgi:hypothetical protein
VPGEIRRERGVEASALRVLRHLAFELDTASPV